MRIPSIFAKRTKSGVGKIGQRAKCARDPPFRRSAFTLFPVPGICPVHGDDLTPGAVVGQDGVRREKAPGSISLPHLGHFIKTLLFQGRWVFPLPVVLQRLAPQRAAPRQAGEKRGDGLCHRQAFPAGKGESHTRGGGAPRGEQSPLPTTDDAFHFMGQPSLSFILSYHGASFLERGFIPGAFMVQYF